MVRDARVTGPISRAVCHHEPVRAVDSISLPTFIELLKNHPLVREKKDLSKLAPSTSVASRLINLRIVVTGTPPSSSWALVIETSRYPSLPVHLLVIQLPSRIRNPENCLNHRGGNNYEIAVQVQGTALPAEFADLSADATTKAIPALCEPSAKWPAAIAIRIARGRVSITIHEHN